MPTWVRDVRSDRVVFLSHCLLNQNTRYLGGATCPGVVAAAVDPYVRDGSGIVQLPCPEQRVWGGVVKRHLLWVIDHPRLARAAPALLPLVRWYVRRRYASLARAVVDDIADYCRSGFDVAAIVGVAGSPSCGARLTLDLRSAAACIARRRVPVTAEWMNDSVVAPALRPGEGAFVQAVRKQLVRRGLRVPIREYDLPPVPAGPASRAGCA